MRRAQVLRSGPLAVFAAFALCLSGCGGSGKPTAAGIASPALVIFGGAVSTTPSQMVTISGTGAALPMVLPSQPVHVVVQLDPGATNAIASLASVNNGSSLDSFALKPDAGVPGQWSGGFELGGGDPLESPSGICAVSVQAVTSQGATVSAPIATFYFLHQS